MGDRSGAVTQSRTYHPATATAAGCVFALAFALMTGFLLLINGAIVLTVLNEFSNQLPLWMRKPQFLQFLLFFFPVVMVALQWILWDLLRALSAVDIRNDLTSCQRCSST